MVKVCPQRRTGFTLVELLVVIVIIGILAGLLIPAIINAIRQAKIAACASNLSQLGKTLMTHMTRNRGQVPKIDGPDLWLYFQKTTPPLISPNQLEVMFCTLKGEQDGPGETDYRGPAVFVSRQADDDPLGADEEGNHGAEHGGNVLFRDGSVRHVDFDDPLWELCRTKLK